jgi:hypothetical protein
MKPEHRAWIERLWSILDAATDDVLRHVSRSAHPPS